MLDEENITRQSVNAQLKEHQLELSHILEVTSMDLLIRFAKIGLGIACVIRQFVQKELDEGILVEVPMGFYFPDRKSALSAVPKNRGSLCFSIFAGFLSTYQALGTVRKQPEQMAQSCADSDRQEAQVIY